MKIKGTLNYEFELRDKDFTYKTEGTSENSLISLCMVNSMITTFESKLKSKDRKTREDKTNLAYLKSAGYVLRQFVAGCISDVKNEQIKKSEVSLEVVKEEVLEPQL